MMDDNEKTKQFLSEQQFMVLAVTLDDGTPWAVPVRMVRQESNEFEWDSALGTVHSQAIEARSDMAITLFQKNEDSQVGFYASGRGELVEETKPGFGRYRFTAEECWLNDETFVKRKVEIS